MRSFTASSDHCWRPDVWGGSSPTDLNPLQFPTSLIKKKLRINLKLRCCTGTLVCHFSGLLVFWIKTLSLDLLACVVSGMSLDSVTKKWLYYDCIGSYGSGQKYSIWDFLYVSKLHAVTFFHFCLTWGHLLILKQSSPTWNL